MLNLIIVLVMIVIILIQLYYGKLFKSCSS